ncbi:ABC transporter ATP-binding protein [Neptunomonas sp. XY-337]|uniref:ABC transporter ATP-binding protein n=1 Tax=Neptunomonas sp. XY-337 TaxID=2561897 RepID=UPI0010A9A75C|nr:ABC transporter ATP-binding protein [Neptunomonas sp. XY-337]
MNAQPHTLVTPLLTLTDISIAYGDHLAVSHAQMQLGDGEIGCLLGPSGCGKSTLLRAIAGFEPLQSGQLSMGGRILATNQQMLPPEKRNIGMVFQDVALFPHLNIADNIAFGLQKLSRKERTARITELLKLVGLPGVEQRFPHSLSGGQQQRIALARALAPRPQLLLLDEPFSGLDAKLRESLVPEVRSILKTLGISALMVSHDQHEAFAIADKIGVMNDGQVLQWASAEEVYNQPSTHFVAEFIGHGDFIHGTVHCPNCVDSALGRLRSEIPHGFNAGEQVEVLVRLQNVQYDAGSPYSAQIQQRTFRGANILYSLLLSNGDKLACLTDPSVDIPVGAAMPIRPELQNLVAFPASH